MPKQLSGQLGLFDGSDLLTTPAKKLSRRSDPATSAEAARELVESGKHDADKMRVLRALRTWWQTAGTPITAGELAHEYHLGANDDQGYAIAHKRLPGLRDDGLVTTDGSRECTIRNSKCQCWRPMPWNS